MRWRDLGFLLPFVLALLPALSVTLVARGMSVNLAGWLPLIVIFGLLPLIDVVCGKDTDNFSAAEAARIAHSAYYRILAMLTLPAWLLTIGFATWASRHVAFDTLGMLGWLLSSGVLGGILAINPAHELIHKSSAFERAFGGVLLSSVGYHGFKIEHVRGHHVHVATPRDSSSAQLGESVYRFVPQALWHNVRNAFRLEAERLRGRGRSVWSPSNEMLCWTMLWLLFVAASGALFGGAGALFFLATGVLAAISLEIINYIEHYGLSRSSLGGDRYERVSHLHSWNATSRLGNWLLFNLQRHSDHHETARRRYSVLLHHADSPQLPAGYASMFVLALVPPLWRRVMDPRVPVQRLTTPDALVD